MQGKKKISIMLIVVLMMQIMMPLMTVIIESDFTLFSIATEEENSWDVSENGDGSIIATLDENGVLTISGNGEMKDWEQETRIPYYYKEIEEVNIQKGITGIGSYTFYGRSGLRSINVASENEVFSSINGVLFNKEQTILVTYPAGRAEQEYAVPDRVISIVENAFYLCENLITITLPESLTEIGSKAFAHCRFNSITIPEGVTSIEAGTFYSCRYLNSIKLPESLTKIGNSAFAYCDESLVSITIPEGVMSIGNYAFYNCGWLKSISLPESLTEIGEYAFNNCRSLISITIPERVTCIERETFSGCFELTNIMFPDGVTSIGNYAFNGCWRLTSVVLPKGLMQIGNSAFANCGLTSITIPEKVTIIGNSAFIGCNRLTSITMPDGITSIGEFAFASCSGLTSIVLPKGINIISEGTFSGCSSLPNITIPEGVTSIRERAFKECSSLTSITIPKNVNRIGSNVFEGCTRLNSINVASENENFSSINGVLFNKEQINLITYPEGRTESEYKIPDGVRTIEDRAFYSCNNLNRITIPDGVTIIGKETFSRCSCLTNIAIPEGVISIGNSAFTYCINLENIVIPENIEKVGDYIFYYSILIIPIEESEEEIMPEILSRAMNKDDALYSNNIDFGDCDLNETGDKIKVNVGDCIYIKNGKLNGLTIKIVPSGFIGYSEEKWTKSNVYSIIHLKEGENVTNNENNIIHAFTENGEFTYTYLTKEGDEKQVTAVVENIDKIPPIINKVVKYYDKWNKDRFTIEIDAEDSLSGLGTTSIGIFRYDLVFSFNGGMTWQKEKSEIFSDNFENWFYIENIENIKIAVRDILGNITEYTGEIVDITTEIEEFRVKEKEGVKYIKDIKEKTTINELKEKINTQGLVEIYKDNKKIEDENTKLGTGMEVIISFINGDSISYTVVVSGDINGDGDVKASDLSRLKNSLIGRTELEGAYKEAADTNGDGNLKASDLSKLKRMIVGV